MTDPDLKVLPTAEERMSDLPEPPTKAVQEIRDWNRRVILALLIAGVALATTLIVAAIAVGGQSEAEKRSQANASAAAQANEKADVADRNATAAGDGLKEANRRLAQLGKPTVAVPTISVSTPPEIVTEGLSGEQLTAVQSLIAAKLASYQPVMSAAQVQQAAMVAASLVPKPKDGKTPTAADLQPLIAATHLAYCANGRCDGKIGPSGAPGGQGSVGPSGAPGQPGASGAPGKDAPAVTDDQLRPLITERLTAFCAAEGDPCRGLRGEQGERGAQGFQGRSLMGQDCAPDGRWRQYWVDPAKGAEQEIVYVDGPCKVVLLPPEPTDSAARKTR